MHSTQRSLFATWLLLILAGALNVPSAQEGPKPEASQTHLEAILDTKDSLVVKDFYTIGNVRGLKVNALLLFEPVGNIQKVKGLHVEITDLGGVHSSFLDMDEIPGLLQAIDYMNRLVGEWKGTREAYSEVVFETKDDFRLGFYQKGSDQKVFASSGTVGRASFFGKPEDLSTLKDMIIRGSEKLKGL